MTAKKKKSSSSSVVTTRKRVIEVPQEDEGLGFTAWMIGSRALRWIAGVLAALAGIVVAWHTLELPIMATREFVHITVQPLDNGIKMLTVGSLQNRIETLSNRRASAQQSRSEKQIQLRTVGIPLEVSRLLQEQIDGLEQQIKDLDKQVEDLQEQIRRKNT
jgi:hypothetical protein